MLNFYHCGCFDIQFAFIMLLLSSLSVSKLVFYHRRKHFPVHIRRQSGRLPAKYCASAEKNGKERGGVVIWNRYHDIDIMIHILHDCMGVLLRMIIKIYMFIMKILVK